MEEIQVKKMITNKILIIALFSLLVSCKSLRVALPEAGTFYNEETGVSIIIHGKDYIAIADSSSSCPEACQGEIGSGRIVKRKSRFYLSDPVRDEKKRMYLHLVSVTEKTGPLNLTIRGLEVLSESYCDINMFIHISFGPVGIDTLLPASNYIQFTNSLYSKYSIKSITINIGFYGTGSIFQSISLYHYSIGEPYFSNIHFEIEEISVEDVCLFKPYDSEVVFDESGFVLDGTLRFRLRE